MEGKGEKEGGKEEGVGYQKTCCLGCEGHSGTEGRKTRQRAHTLACLGRE
jgi:hypothetical protein